MNKPSIKSFKNVVIVQTAFIGDAVLSLYMAAEIKKVNPGAVIKFVTTPVSGAIAKRIIEIDKVIGFDKRNAHRGLKGLKTLASCLRAPSTAMIVPHRSFRSALLTKLASPDFSAGFNTSAGSFLFDRRIRYCRDLHEVQRNMLLLTAFREFEDGIINVDAKAGFCPEEEEEEKVNRLLENYNLAAKKYVILAPGSVWATKRWSEEGFTAVAAGIEKIGLKCLLIGGKEDSELCCRIEKRSSAINLAGMTSLCESILLFRDAACAVANDSAPAHFANLMNCPAIIIFGATSPIFGFSPFRPGDTILHDDGLKCSPCEIHGSRKCPLGTLDCMNNITPEMVLGAIKKYI